MSASHRFTPQDVMDVFHERNDADLGPRYLYVPPTVSLLSILGLSPEQEEVISAQYERGDFARYYNVGLH